MNVDQYIRMTLTWNVLYTGAKQNFKQIWNLLTSEATLCVDSLTLHSSV